MIDQRRLLVINKDGLGDSLDLNVVFWRLRNYTRSVFFNICLSRNGLVAAMAILRLSVKAVSSSFFRALASFAFNLNIDWELTGERKTVSLLPCFSTFSPNESPF